MKDRGHIDESHWLNQERGEVVHSDPYCNYYVVETDYGYIVLRSSNGYKPFEGTIVFGNFSNYGVRDFYNRSGGIIFTSEVKEYC